MGSAWSRVRTSTFSSKQQDAGTVRASEEPVAGLQRLTKKEFGCTMNTDGGVMDISRIDISQKKRSNHNEVSGLHRIAAGGRAGGSWGLMDMLGSATVFCGKGDQEGIRLEVCNTGRITTEGKRLIRAVARGIDQGQYPSAAVEGMGGTYFFKSTNNRSLAIFKPCNEEPLAPCNPKGFVGRFLGDPGWKATVRVGEGALREVAACLLDHGRFSNVPTTVLCRASHPVFHNLPAPSIECTESGSMASSLAGVSESSSPSYTPSPAPMELKVGSMQQFVDHVCDTSEMGTSRFSAQDVHKIGILDVRLFNTDRHAGNMLVRKFKGELASDKPSLSEAHYELVPIDHGFCLPEALEPPYFEWLHWPQARLPFTEEELQYIKNLDIAADKSLLRRELPVLREESLRTMEVATTLLKLCAAEGLSLNEIGEIMSRPMTALDDGESELEKLCMNAKQRLYSHPSDLVGGSGSDDGSGFESPRLIDELQFSFDDVKGLYPEQGHSLGRSLAKTMSSLSSCSTPCLGMMSTLDAALGTQTLYNAETSSKGPSSPDCNSRKALPDRLRTAQSLALPSQFFAHPNPQGNQPYEAMISPKRKCNKSAYPCPVEGAAPSHKNSIFSDMTEEDWLCFMLLFEDNVHQMLQSRHTGGCQIGKKKLGAPSTLAYSCPKF